MFAGQRVCGSWSKHPQWLVKVFGVKYYQGTLLNRGPCLIFLFCLHRSLRKFSSTVFDFQAAFLEELT